MRQDLNRQAKAFLIALGIPWLVGGLIVFLIIATICLRWLGVLRTYIE